MSGGIIPTVIETASGQWYDFAAPTADQVTLEDIATALGNQCRWRGQIPHFYSVAEHAVRTSILVQAIASPELALHALHHDSHEAYVGDCPTPQKTLLGDVFARQADEADQAICEALGLDPELLRHDIVKAADHLALRYEAALLKVSKGAKQPGWPYVEPLDPPGYWKVGYGWAPADARKRFLVYDAAYREAMADA